MKEADNIARQWMARLMLVLFVAYYANITFFPHTHIINGQKIVHSHVLWAGHTTTADGGHSTSTITLIKQLSNYVSLAAVIYAINLTPFPLPENLPLPPQNWQASSGHISALLPRAPPMM